MARAWICPTNRLSGFSHVRKIARTSLAGPIALCGNAVQRRSSNVAWPRSPEYYGLCLRRRAAVRARERNQWESRLLWSGARSLSPGGANGLDEEVRCTHGEGSPLRRVVVRIGRAAQEWLNATPSLTSVA
jgi:hypothetical protein